MDVFEDCFKRADLDRDGKISGPEAVAFFQGSNLPKNVLAQVWMYADQNRTGFLGRPEFFNALKLITVAQSGRQLTPEIVKSALYGPAAAKIPAPKINPASSPTAQLGSAATPALHTSSLNQPSNQFGGVAPNTPQNLGFRPTHPPQNAVMNQQFFPTTTSNFTRPPQAPLASVSPQIQGGNMGLTGGNVTGPRLASPSNSNISNEWLSVKPGGTSVGGTPVRGSSPSQSLDGFGLTLSGMMGASSQPQTQSVPASSLVTKPSDLPTSKPSESKALVVSGSDFSSGSLFGGDVFSATSQPKSDGNVFSFLANSTPNSSGIAPAAAGAQSSVRPAQLGPAQVAHLVPSAGSQLQQTQSNIRQNQFDNSKTSPALAGTNGAVELANSAANQTQVQWPKITQADIKKYTNVFVNVDKDRDGKITGEQARMLFLSWKLPREVLKQVWDLSDQDNDSMLSLREFCIALYLMERYREGRPLPSALPSTVMYDETLLRAVGMPSAAYGVPTWQPGLSQQGPLASRPPLPTTGVRPPMQNPIPSQSSSAGQLMQQNLRKPGLNNHIAKDLGRDLQSSTVNSNQEPANADSKVQEVEKQILDSKEKIEFYRTKMQELVLYKSRCDNRLNEITERASADKREVEMLAKMYEEKYKAVGELASKLAIEEAKNRDIQERKMELHNAIIKMEQGGSADGLLQVRVDRIQSDLEGLEKALNDRCKQHNVHVKAATSIELPFGWESGPLDGAADWDEDWDKFEDEGFIVIKDLTSGAANTVVNGEPKSPSIWSDKASTEETLPVASLNFDGKNEKLYGMHEHTNGSPYDNSEEGSTRSPTSSPGRSTLESPFNSTQFGIHEVSSHDKERHSDPVDDESIVSGDKYTDEPWTFDDTDSVWKETDYEGNSHNAFFTSDFGPTKADSPSASSVFAKEKRSSFFEDSVPSSPMFNDGRGDYNFNSFSRFDSFSTHDSGAFPARESFSRFDSISSHQPETLARFDSISSSRDVGHRRGFESFDDADPFGATGPFKSSGGHSPSQGSDNWRVF
ncbi:actin cytoskeleton-regulatory complex protein PAN1-like isoform X2 [Canna indica]|uniref:Actin cytoskeleton-regulatory complex protein PAN1-like isoform X2 n=1 Tax=Canna indica TaxID=4628 RepID=A0AAQ3KJ03_9LILI|nr:actin cytoskeleton-regulatory complex protein PAN1-like isoform X2 [Canna indica]